MTLNLTIPQQTHTDFTPRITVIGVGGGGTNAVDNMIALNLQGVEFVVANTDAQQLMHSRATRRIQLGPHITQGLGAGAKPEIGRAAAEEASDELYRHLDGAHMVFITAGMGGGTGTGAAPVIARMARERNILTVGVVTKPFSFEGTRRARAADQGIEELQQYVDTLIVIPNQNLFRMANERTTWKDAFKMADHVLYMGVRGVTDLMVAPGLVNLDFADIRTVMAEMGKAMMGTGEAEGENRAVRAAEAAISNPLLEDTSMAGARGLLINITGGEDMTLFEVDQAANRIREEVDEDANIIFGSAIDETLQGTIRVSVVATGIDTPAAAQPEQRPRLVAVGGGAAQAVSVPQGPMTAGPGMTFGTSAGPVPLSAVAPSAATLRAQAMMQPESFAESAAGHQAQAGAAQAHAVSAGLASPRAAPPPPARSGLFADPARSPVVAMSSASHAAEPPRPSLFKAVTGAVTGRLRHSLAPIGTGIYAAPPAESAPMQEEQPALEPRSEPIRPSVRPASGEDMGLEIPAFLRRQSS
ncbi:MAG: cell division protein FtsZ [Acetobacteraceae bacterium]|nr:cell division protein FtsZ [Acetobacteraceae bacterium]